MDTKEMTYSLEFTVDDLPKTVNGMGKTSFWYRVNENKKWQNIVSIKVVGRRPLKPLEKAKVTCTRVSSREPDRDNLYHSFKSVIDALVRSKIIIDDKASVIDLKCEWRQAKPKQGHIIVRVEAA